MRIKLLVNVNFQKKLKRVILYFPFSKTETKGRRDKERERERGGGGEGKEFDTEKYPFSTTGDSVCHYTSKVGRKSAKDGCARLEE